MMTYQEKKRHALTHHGKRCINVTYWIIIMIMNVITYKCISMKHNRSMVQ